MFDQNSGLVKIWIRNVENGNVFLEQVPNLSNLRDVVILVINRK